jgi:hypothetical protein
MQSRDVPAHLLAELHDPATVCRSLFVITDSRFEHHHVLLDYCGSCGTQIAVSHKYTFCGTCDAASALSQLHT